MYLKRLEIKGFKSFSGKTVLDFFGSKDGRNSVTAIVGPNGSGKSNISDAVRWVMGEQSYKNLRGKKSEDVIFGGSQTKGQLSAAEVVMILDNTGGDLMKDYSEITITRRLYRSGEGEYLINNNSVRLLDIHLLLAKAQFAQHSYSIVGQGMIDHMLTISPSERKDFLDEASGIKEFKIKQHQARLKLNRTKENIEQARRLIQEVEPRLRMLSRQVKKLEKRHDVEIKLRTNQEQYYSYIYLTNKKELDNLKNSLTEVEKNYHNTFVDLKQVQEELAELARASTRQQVFDKLQSDYQLIVREKHELERSFAIKQGQVQSEYSKEGKQNVAWIEKQLSSLKNKKDELFGKVNELEIEAEKLDKFLSDKKKLVEELSEEKANCQIEISCLEKQVLEGQSEQNFRQYTGLLAVQAILENRNRFGKVYGLLAELGEVEEDYRLALEVAAGSYLSALVVEDENTARLAIEFLRKNHLGTATFLPLNKIFSYSNVHNSEEILNEFGVKGLASDLVKYRSKFENIFSFVFGRTVVVEDLKSAQGVGIGKARMVTLKGDLIEKSGVMRGGYRQVRKGGLGFAQNLSLNRDDMVKYQTELEIKKKELADLESQLVGAQSEIIKLETQKESVSAKVEMLTNEQNSAVQEIASLEQDTALLNADPKEYGNILSQLNKEKDSLVEKIKDKEDEIARMAEKIENFNKEEEDKKQRVFALQDKMQKEQNKLNEIMSERNELRVKIARLETKQDGIEEEVRTEMSMAINTVVKREDLDLEEVNVEELSSTIQKLKYQLTLIGGIDEEVVEEYDQTKEKYDFLSIQIKDLDGAIEDLEKMIVELDEIMKKKGTSAFKTIRKEFSRYIKILFDGGSGDMREVYGEESVEEENEMGDEESVTSDLGVIGDQDKKGKKNKILVGIDIMINPPGKKIKNINTLSGGERTLASIALICAVLSYNPAPFVVLDEVEAALDEVNTHRFAKIVSELSNKSQFIIITHNRVTMHSADALYGVTMGTDGISKLLSVKLSDV